MGTEGSLNRGVDFLFPGHVDPSDDMAVVVGHDLLDHIAGEHFLTVDDAGNFEDFCRLALELSLEVSTFLAARQVAEDGFVDGGGRLGNAVGHVGFIGALGIILLGHAVTIPTALAVAEIATNKKVEGGGDYYVISRSFGLNIGAAIGIALYLSQAISIAFYIIAFAEAFAPFGAHLNENYNLGAIGSLLEKKKAIGLGAMSFLTALMLTKGANIGIKALYGVAAILFLSLTIFFMGESQISLSDVSFVRSIENSDIFF